MFAKMRLRFLALRPLELQIFERLIRVSGIGPKLALAGSPYRDEELVAAIRQANVARLTAISWNRKEDCRANRGSNEGQNGGVPSGRARAVRRVLAIETLRTDVLSALMILDITVRLRNGRPMLHWRRCRAPVREHSQILSSRIIK